MALRLISDLGSKRVGIWSFLPRMRRRGVMALGWLRWSGRKRGRSQQAVLYICLRAPPPPAPESGACCHQLSCLPAGPAETRGAPGAATGFGCELSHVTVKHDVNPLRARRSPIGVPSSSSSPERLYCFYLIAVVTEHFTKCWALCLALFMPLPLTTTPGDA